ncbi:MAG TPA: hypothetical protein DIC46_13095, partial [Porphyromonadaceae bacterium]|nr:hypothetical protein [Porphyromonadaceae bacterium]
MKKVSLKILFGIVAIVCICFESYAQKYTFKNELELLKRVDKLPEYRTNSYVEQISSYDTTGGNDDGFDGTYSYLRKEKEG